MILYRFASALIRVAARTGLPELRIDGLANIPAEGPFLIIANHQSILDPLLIQAFCPRPVFTMAKSTQFSHPIMRWLMLRALSFPVRRYQIDPQAARTVLDHLRHGHGVGIYPEGERTWDGALQPPRLGTIRLILKAGVPVVPTTISGAYDVWPRWHTAIRPGPIHICFGSPISFPSVQRRADREAALPETTATIMATLQRQLDMNIAGATEAAAGVDHQIIVGLLVISAQIPSQFT